MYYVDQIKTLTFQSFIRFCPPTSATASLFRPSAVRRWPFTWSSTELPSPTKPEQPEPWLRPTSMPQTGSFMLSTKSSKYYFFAWWLNKHYLQIKIFWLTNLLNFAFKQKKIDIVKTNWFNNLQGFHGIPISVKSLIIAFQKQKLW